jgi:transposase
MDPKRINMHIEEIKALIPRAGKNQLTEEDCKVVVEVLGSCICLSELLEENKLTILRLRKLFGSQTERSKYILPKDEKSDETHPPNPSETEAKTDGTIPSEPEQNPTAPPKSKKKVKGHGRKGSDAYTGAKRVKVDHTNLKSGDVCPECESGKLHVLNKHGSVLHLIGQAPIQATVYEVQILRCSSCQQTYTAKTPNEAGTKKYDESAGAIIVILRYGFGFPNSRLECLQSIFGVPVPGSTQWEISKEVSESCQPIYDELIRQSAQADVLYNDDTLTKILSEMKNPTHPDPKRKGLFTTAIVADGSDRKIVTFVTGHNHAGENLTAMLQHRDDTLPPPIQMCDASTRNIPDAIETLLAHCLTHGRRKFVDLLLHFPQECRFFIESLSHVYENDKLAHQQCMSPDERLIFHQKKSAPVMDNLHHWLSEQFDRKNVEQNSSLGKAISYMLNHWQQFTLFLRVPGAPLDNNICERALKMAIRHRRNSLFYKTPKGAHVGDIFMSIIYTCQYSNINPFDYLIALQKNAQKVDAHPELWLPWNYLNTIALESKSA